jgi:hypothetical protein
LPGSAFDWPGHTNLASGIHHEAYDCDNHNEAAEHAAKLEGYAELGFLGINLPEAPDCLEGQLHQ